MVKLIREILVLPLKLLFLITRFVPVVDQYVLVKWIWKVGRTTEAGFEIVMMTVEKFGLEAGRDLAHEILKETKSAMIVHGIALQEWLEGDCDAAKEWIDLAEEMDYQDRYHLLSLKLTISHKIAEYDHAEIVEEMLTCNHLPMEYTCMALLNKAYLLFKEKQYHESEEIVDQMLKVRNDQAAEELKVIICLARNEDILAMKLLAKSKKRLSEIDYNISIALAYFMAGRIDESMEWVYNAVMGGYNKEEGHQAIKNLIESAKFADYCVMQN